MKYFVVFNTAMVFAVILACKWEFRDLHRKLSELEERLEKLQAAAVAHQRWLSGINEAMGVKRPPPTSAPSSGAVRR